MADNQTNNNTSDEIDLGQLFQIIGRAFQQLFDFIGSIFKWLFHIFILLLLFFQKNFIIIVIAAVTGAIGGYFIDGNKTIKYASKMIVEPNFNSTEQLYNNIDFYNDLAVEEDTITLARTFNISETEAKSIKGIFIEAYIDENQKIKLFDEFVKGLDTTTVKEVKYESYSRNFNRIDAKFHTIYVVSTDSDIARKLIPTIINSIATNAYFKLQKKINDENLNLQEIIYEKQLNELDSLQDLYKKVSLKLADKQTQGTNINLSENGDTQNKELKLIQERDVLKERLVELNMERANKSSILNIISDFSSSGIKEKNFWKNYKFVLPLVLVGLVLLIIILLRLNKYLKNYNN